MNKSLRIIIAVAGAVVALCVVCVVIGSIYNATPAGKVSQTEIASAKETTAAAPTNTQTPTKTPEPTKTKRPTNTPAATKTKKPTLTPKPPTDTLVPTIPPEPVLLTGTGDSIVDFENPFDFAIVHVTGNTSSGHFAVINYDESGERIDLLINTTDPYDGIRPLDFNDGEHTTRFEVTAKGDWTIEILPLTSALILEVPGTLEGTGDAVILLLGEKPDTAAITGNEDSSHFAIIGHGNRSDLMVNTTDPYQGTVIVQSGTMILEIKAVGSWSIEIKSK